MAILTIDLIFDNLTDEELADSDVWNHTESIKADIKEVMKKYSVSDKISEISIW